MDSKVQSFIGSSSANCHTIDDTMESDQTFDVCTRFEQTEFCYICARYIKLEKERKRITEEIAEMFYDIYGKEINWSSLDAPERICLKCEDSIKNYVTGNV